MERKKKIRLAIILLAVLLGISATALGATLIHRRILQKDPGKVTVPDNLITPDEDTGASAAGATAKKAGADGAAQTRALGMTLSASSQTQSGAGTVPTADKKETASLSLSSRQPQDNTAFRAENLFPGDSETKYYRVAVSYHDKVSVHYKAVIRQGYEKLSEVMMMRVKLLTTGEVLYDGLMRDMPQQLTCTLESAQSTTDELYYEITAYLDTSVGNAYQNRYLIADFSWWVEETGNLDGPKTGDGAQIWLWSALAALSCGGLIFLVVSRKRKGEKKHG